MLVLRFHGLFTLAKFKMPISQQQNMIETRFKNWYVHEYQLYKLRNMGRVPIRAGALITVNTVNVC